MNASDPLFGLYVVCVAMSIVCGVLVATAILYEIGEAISQLRLRRRLRNLPTPDDPRLRNVFSILDYRNRETCEKRFRRAA
jgi:hypothetical protein